MSAGDVLRLLLVAVGLGLFVLSTVSLAKKHMTETFCIFWGLIAVIFIVVGIIIRPIGWNQYISWPALVMIFLGLVALLIAGYFFSIRISNLIRQTTELAIQVSLLNLENELLSKELAESNEEFAATAGEKYEEDHLIRH